MNRTINAIMLISLLSLSMQAMESESGSSSSSMGATSEKIARMMISIEIPKARNALGESYVQEYLDLNGQDPISLETLGDRINAKHVKSDSYMLARIVEQVDDGAVVQYCDAHGLNRALFGLYPFKNLRGLWNYKNPISNLPLQWLEYYECRPQEKVFKFMCSYAVLCSNHSDKRAFWHHIFYANQDDVKLAASAKFNLGIMYEKGLGVAANCPRAKELYEQVANQTHNLESAASAKINLGAMYAREEDYARAKELYEQVANQTHNLKSVAIAKNNLGAMYERELGVVRNYAMAKQYYEQAANQMDDLEARQIARINLVELEVLMKKNGLEALKKKND